MLDVLFYLIGHGIPLLLGAAIPFHLHYKHWHPLIEMRRQQRTEKRLRREAELIQKGKEVGMKIIITRS